MPPGKKLPPDPEPVTLLTNFDDGVKLHKLAHALKYSKTGRYNHEYEALLDKLLDLSIAGLK